MPIFRRRPPPEPPSDPPDLPTRWQEWARVPPGREELAAEIESSADFGVDRVGPGTLHVNLFDDVRGMVGDPAIEALPDALAGLPGIERCVHSDREIIEVEGPIATGQLAAFVIAELAATADPDYWDYQE